MIFNVYTIMIDAVFLYIYIYIFLQAAQKTPPHLHDHFLQTIMNFTAKKKQHDISEVGAIPLLSGMLESDQVLHVSTVRTNLNDHG